MTTAPGLIRAGSVAAIQARELGIGLGIAGAEIVVHQGCLVRKPGQGGGQSGADVAKMRWAQSGMQSGCAAGCRSKTKISDQDEAGGDGHGSVHCLDPAPVSGHSGPQIQAGVASRHARCASRRLMKLSSLLNAFTCARRLARWRLSSRCQTGQAPCRRPELTPVFVAGRARRAVPAAPTRSSTWSGASGR